MDLASLLEQARAAGVDPTQALGSIPNRICGECTACCKAMLILDLDPPKPAGRWCPHALLPDRDGRHGCGIYASRPPSCRDFRCGWLLGWAPEEDLRPDRSGVVINAIESSAAFVRIMQERFRFDAIPICVSLHELWARAADHPSLRSVHQSAFEHGMPVIRVAPSGAAECRMPVPDPSRPGWHIMARVRCDIAEGSAMVDFR